MNYPETIFMYAAMEVPEKIRPPMEFAFANVYDSDNGNTVSTGGSKILP
jgi:hypothetical protein